MLRILIALAIILVISFLVVDYQVRSVETANTDMQEFTIAGTDSDAGRDSLFDVGQKLEDQNVISSRYFFYYHAWRNKLRGKLLAGVYEIQPQSSLTEISEQFIKGKIKEEKPVEIQVLFKEGLTLTEYVDAVREAGLPHEEFLALAKNPSPEIMNDYDFLLEGSTLEGYLFPDTYNFFPGASAETIIRKTLDNFAAKVSSSLRADIARKGKSLSDVVILASIVEGEVTEGIDRKLVAGVFQKRLDIGMALQTDASIDYIKGIAEIKHTLEDLKIDSPYNTYLYPGLPPGPINNPSLDSIIAAANPAETDYLFFLNSNKEENRGETIFAETYAEHLINKDANGL